MKSTWIDLTDIEQWSGHHGGTQRVVYGIAKQYYLDNEMEVRFFSYSPAKDIFYETSFVPILDRVEKLKSQVIIDSSKNTSLKHKIKKKLLHYTPTYVKNNKRLKNNVKTVVKKSLATARRVDEIRARYINVVRKKYGNSRLSMDALQFQSDDTVLILGKPWDNPGLQKLLMEQKKAARFKVVQVVYDLIICLYPHLHHPSLFKSYTQHMFDAVAVSDLMLPISKSSDRDLKEFCKQLNLPIPKTAIIRLGDEIDLPENSPTKNPDDRIDDTFLICVGTIENRKNHMLLYQTYKLAQERRIELPQLIVVGAKGWLSDDVQYLISHDPAIKNKIIILHNVSDASLEWLYQNCLFTLYPSLYEGWGLPVAESLVYGKVSVASNASSIPEIAGDLLNYFSPNSTDECLKAIIAMMNNESRIESERRIMQEYQPTSWHHTYIQTTRSIERL